MVSYVPRVPPSDAASLPGFILTELQAIAREWQQTQPFLLLDTLHASPSKPREGMCVLADGTDWNPGSGAGVYVYRASAWHFLG